MLFRRVLFTLPIAFLAFTLAASAQVNPGENGTDSAIKGNPALASVVDKAGLPRVLLIGDSVSIGYTVGVQQLLAGKANVHRIPENGTSSTNGVRKIKQYIGDGHWDVIHVNFGLHDAKLPPEGIFHSDIPTYESNLHIIVKALKATGAKIIWATTTPTPNHGVLSPTRRFAPIEDYNAAAVKIMQENGIAVDDLFSVVNPVLEQVQRPHDVHFKPEGYMLLSKAVADSITKQFATKP